jgi:hypothetical protein
VLGDAHRAELDRQRGERLGASERLGVGTGDLGHRPQAVQDPARQTDRAGELVVDVDRVEVS